MQLSQANSPFTILGLGLTPTDAEVRKAYRRLAMRYHPDRNLSEGAEDKFKRIQQAYQMIKDETSREQVRVILQMYAYAGATDSGFGANVAPERSRREASYGRAPMPEAPAHRPSRAATVGYLLRAHLGELKLAVRMALRLERLPAQLLLYLGALLGINLLALDSELGGWRLLALSLVQASCLALATDLVLQLSANNRRYLLRRKIDRFVFYAIIVAGTGIAISYEGSVLRLVELLGLPAELVLAVSLLLLGTAGYVWLIFGFILERHSRFWEWLAVTLGMGVMGYFSSLLYFQFSV